MTTLTGLGTRGQNTAVATEPHPDAPRHRMAVENEGFKMTMLVFDELPEGTDVSALEELMRRIDSAGPHRLMAKVRDEYPPCVHAFRRANWRLLGMEPAPTPGGSVDDALRAGFFKTRLRDGSDGYMMRRTDDCSTMTVATLAGVHPSFVPDPQEMRRILSGTDPDQVLAEIDVMYRVFAAQTGVRLRVHAAPPVWAKRWIAVVEKDENPLANHLMVMSGRDLLFDPAHIAPNDGETALEGWGIDDISFGYTVNDY